jgi:hypothetical protein
MQSGSEDSGLTIRTQQPEGMRKCVLEGGIVARRLEGGRHPLRSLELGSDHHPGEGAVFGRIDGDVDFGGLR